MDAKAKVLVCHPTPELRRRADNFCRETGMPRTEMMRRALHEYLYKREAHATAVPQSRKAR